MCSSSGRSEETTIHDGGRSIIIRAGDGFAEFQITPPKTRMSVGACLALNLDIIPSVQLD